MLTKAELDMLDEDHSPIEPAWDTDPRICDACRSVWPCETYGLLRHIEQSNAGAVAQLKAIERELTKLLPKLEQAEQAEPLHYHGSQPCSTNHGLG
jgi:hypothetical protein